MAIFHLSVKAGSKGSGQTSRGKAEYITRTGKYARDSMEVEYVKSGNMPKWANGNSKQEYWRATDMYERANAVLYREIEVALPRELDSSQHKVLLNGFVSDVARREMPFTYAMHKGAKAHNPHCHLILSEKLSDGYDRTAKKWFSRAANKGSDPSLGGARKADIGGYRKKWLTNVRQLWEYHVNKTLKEQGFDERVDHRSYEERGINRVPGVHMGPRIAGMVKRKIQTARGDRHAKTIEINQTIKKLENEIKKNEIECEEINKRMLINACDNAPMPVKTEQICIQQSKTVGKKLESFKGRASAQPGMLRFLLFHVQRYGPMIKIHNTKRPKYSTKDIEGWFEQKQQSESNSDRFKIFSEYLRYNFPDIDSCSENIGLEASTLNDARFAFLWRVNMNGLIVFPHMGLDNLMGYEVCNPRDSDFSVNGKGGLWFTRNISEAKEIVFVSSGINALSHAELKKEPGNAYVSIGGTLSPLQQQLITAGLKRAIEKTDTIIIATSDNKKGRDQAKLLKEIIPQSKWELPCNENWYEDLLDENDLYLGPR